jgi:hypothetical protein
VKLCVSEQSLSVFSINVLVFKHSTDMQVEGCAVNRNRSDPESKSHHVRKAG